MCFSANHQSYAQELETGFKPFLRRACTKEEAIMYLTVPFTYRVCKTREF